MLISSALTTIEGVDLFRPSNTEYYMISFIASVCVFAMSLCLLAFCYAGAYGAAGSTTGPWSERRSGLRDIESRGQRRGVVCALELPRYPSQVPHAGLSLGIIVLKSAPLLSSSRMACYPHREWLRFEAERGC